jgi:hypothetical protein
VPPQGHTKHNRLSEEAAAAAKAAREIAEKAEAGRRPGDDRRRAKSSSTRSRRGRRRRRPAPTSPRDAEVLDQAKALADEIGMPEDAKGDLDAQLRDPEREQAARASGQIVESAQFKALMKPYADGRIPEKARIQSDPIPFKTLIGQKSLFVGGSDTSAGAFVVNERPTSSRCSAAPLTLRDLISVRRTGSDTVEYVRQTSHTNARPRSRRRPAPRRRPPALVRRGADARRRRRLQARGRVGVREGHRDGQDDRRVGARHQAGARRRRAARGPDQRRAPRRPRRRPRRRRSSTAPAPVRT